MTTNASDTMPASAPDASRIEAIIRGRMGDPFEILGPHKTDGGAMGLTVFAPDAAAAVLTLPQPLHLHPPRSIGRSSMPGARQSIA